MFLRLLKRILVDDNLVAVDSRELTKLLTVAQSNESKLDEILESHERLELTLGSQKVLIEKILSRLGQLEEKNEIFVDVKEKGKGKERCRKGAFYQVNIHVIIIFFHIILVTYKYLCYRTRLKN